MITVLPSGVNIVTVASYKNLVKNILKQRGCLVSEYEPNVKASRSYFIERNVVIAILSDIAFVVECDVKSRAVDAASGYKRILSYDYPPNIERRRYAGNEFMIKRL